MDAMALLCMLHADGPSTLKSLRQAGCSTLEAVESMEEMRLSELLGGPPAAARRFAREARHLRERLGPERLGEKILDREESVVETMPASVEFAPAPEFARAPAAYTDATEMADGLAEDGGAESGSDRVVDEALAAWRTLDLEETEAAAEITPPAEPRARPEFEFAPAVLTAIRDLAEPGSVEAPPMPLAREGTRLLPGSLDGLDPEACLVLAAAGVETVEDLAAADPLDLSESVGLGYSRVWRLSCLARRAAVAPETFAARTAETEDFGRSSSTALEAPSSSVLEAVPASELESRAPMSKLTPGSKLSPGSKLTPGSKLSPSERPWKPMPSILELEWNREIRPQAPPPGRAMPGSIPEPAPETEGAGGPFV